MTQQAAIPERFLAAVAADDECEIHPKDAPVVALFFALDTQWRRHPFTGQRVGLDYSAVRPTAELAGIEIGKGMLASLRVMEHAALDALARVSR